MDSGDEWCYVDDEAGSVRWPSFDEMELEMELEMEPEPTHREELPKPATTGPRELSAAISDDEVDVAALLCASNAPSIFSRDTTMALLSSAHRRYVVTGVAAAPKTSTRKRSVCEAFAAPSRPVHSGSSFATRLRAAMASQRHVRVEPRYAETTPVLPMTFDRGVQTDSAEAEAAPDRASRESTRLEDLSFALSRSLSLSMQLKARSNAVERLDIRSMALQTRLDRRDAEKMELKKQLRVAQRGLHISRKRSELTEEYQEHLKREIEQLRAEKGPHHQRIEVLAGGLDAEGKSIAELEQLEDSLGTAMVKVRTALRAKYREAMGVEISAVEAPPLAPANRKQSEEACVVCLVKLACVRLEPCGHHVVCSVATCPVDRQSIQDKVLTHGLNAYTKDQ